MSDTTLAPSRFAVWLNAARPRTLPLALAFAAQPAIRIYRHLDERSAGFFALGLALATGQPVALLCTSGTAAANFHPAIVEAYLSLIHISEPTRPY